MNDADLNAASTHDLLERYVAERAFARSFAEQGMPMSSHAARENAEAIAAEIERRCVR